MIGFPKKIIRYRNQNYEELRKHHLEVGTLYSDPAFPAIDAVLGTSNGPANVVWKRPGDICERPRLFSDINTSRIVRPGEYSCNWMVSALAILADIKPLRNKVIPNYWEQEWTENGRYCGIFHFRIWRFGFWQDVIVDDLLPTMDNCLLTTQAGANNEFWTALVEKAYAKLHGSYEALRERELSDALVDFTGGVSEVIDLQAGGYLDLEDKKTQLFEMLQTELEDHTILCCILNEDGDQEAGSRSELGLFRGHAYHITDLRRVHLAETNIRNLFSGREKVAMVRLRDPRGEGRKPAGSPDSAIDGDGNPYAYTTESLSKFRSRNSKWQQVKDSERQRLGLVFRDPSEFWMPMDDIVWGFSECVLCRLVTENLFATPGVRWKGTALRGRWEAGPSGGGSDRSGGGDPRQSSFLANPQYLMPIPEPCEILIQLLQFRDMDGMDSPHGHINLLIGFHIIKVEENRRSRLHKLWEHTPIVVTEDHRRKREVVYRGWMNPGLYLIVPSTYRPGDTLSYLIRALCRHHQLQIRELTRDAPQAFNPCSCIFPGYEWVTVLIVENAEINKNIASNINPYCLIICEGKKVRTGTAKDDWNPTWGTSYIFYRKKPQKPIVVRVLNKKTLLRDEVVGECELPASVTHSPTPLDAVLLDRGSAGSDPQSAGTIHLTILTEDSLMAV